jgi:hypothetical protein
MSVPDDPAHEETEFKYNSAGQLIEVVKESYDTKTVPYVASWTMSYNNDTLHQISSYSKFYSDPEEKRGEYIFSYNNNLPDTIQYNPANTNSNPVFTVTEYSANKLIKLTDYLLSPQDSNYKLYATRDIDWTGDNISKITTTTNGVSSSTLEYEYDDKKTPLENLGLAFTSFGSLAMLSQNNVTKMTYTSNTTSHITETTYNYNSTGYPTKSTPAKDGYSTNYKYDCK